MREKKIVVPEGMLKAGVEAVRDRSEFGFHFIDNKDEARIVAQTQDTLEAALLWLSENPIVPTNEQTQGVCDSIFVGPENLLDPRDAMVEGQRRMFYAPEPEVRPFVRDIIAKFQGCTLTSVEADAIVEELRLLCHGWDRHVFYAPEPELPESVKYLIEQLDPDEEYDSELVKWNILEAYRIGVRDGHGITGTTDEYHPKATGR